MTENECPGWQGKGDGRVPEREGGAEWEEWQPPHLCSDQGLKAGLEVVQSAVVEARRGSAT